MKTNNLIIVLLIVAVSFLLGHTFANNQAPAREDGRTEEYAIIEIYLVGGTRQQIKYGADGYSEKIEKKLTTEAFGKLNIEEFNALNAKGFELFDSNFVIDGGIQYFIYTFKRKL